MLHSGVSSSLGFGISDNWHQHILLDFMLGRSRKGIQPSSRVEGIERADLDMEWRFFNVGNSCPKFHTEQNDEMFYVLM